MQAMLLCAGFAAAVAWVSVGQQLKIVMAVKPHSMRLYSAQWQGLARFKLVVLPCALPDRHLMIIIQNHSPAVSAAHALNPP